VCLLFLVVVLAGCGGSSARPTTVTTRSAAPALLSFDYPAAAKLGYRDAGVVGREKGVVVRDVSFLSGGKRVEGYLARPAKGDGPFPAVVVVPGTGGDRGELLAPAAALAHRGFAVLSLTEPSTSPPPQAATKSGLLTQQRQLTVADVVAVRRAVDALAALPFVDGGQIGYLGWSSGARLGAFVAAAEPRVRARALRSGGAEPIVTYAAQAPKSLRAQVRRDLGAVDPLRYLPHAHGSVRLADGKQDEVVPHAALLNFAHAAPKGTTVRWYDATHALNELAYNEAFSWLRQQLR
jgi:dienelactone hydrolase